MNDTPPLDRLVSELNSSTVRRAASRSNLEEWLTILGGRGASDLYLVAGLPPSIRLDGGIQPLPEPVLDGEDIEESIIPLLPPHAVDSYRSKGHADASLKRGPRGRFRINLHRERGRAAASIRALPMRPPLLADLSLPPAVEALTRLSSGLILVGGPTGSGKTTTVAALIDAINRRDAKHIITIEDPIEYDHPHLRSVVEQVEIGIDAPDFPTALRSAVSSPPTSSWSARCATRKRCGSRWRLVRPATSSSRRSIPATSRRRCPGYPTRFHRNASRRSARSWRWRSPPS
jgi:Tfp pilus assembly ATPase PilU